MVAGVLQVHIVVVVVRVEQFRVGELVQRRGQNEFGEALRVVWLVVAVWIASVSVGGVRFACYQVGVVCSRKLRVAVALLLRLLLDVVEIFADSSLLALQVGRVGSWVFR